MRRGSLLLCTLILAGCSSREAIYEDLTRARHASYENWRQARTADPRPETRLQGGLPLKDALRLALRYNKRLQAVLEERGIAHGVKLESWSALLPALNLFASYTRLNDKPEIDVLGFQLDIGERDNWAIGFRIRQPLLRTGASFARVRSGKLQAVLADEQVRAAVQLVSFDVAKLYYDSLLADRLYRVNREAVRSSEAQLKTVKAKREGGLGSDYEVFRAEVELSNFRAEMIRQQARIDVSRSQLFRAVGVSQDSEVQFSDRLRFVSTTPKVEEAVKLAMENRADIYAAELALRLQSESVTIAMSRYGPAIDAFFDFAFIRPDLFEIGEDKFGSTWAVGLGLNWTLFDGLKREGQVYRAKARLRQRRIQLFDVEERVLSEVRQAIFVLQSAEEFIQSQSKTVQRAKEALRLAEVGYQEGTRTQVEITDARAALTRARNLYYEALHAHSLSRLSLQRAMGILGPRFGETEKDADKKTDPGRIKEFEKK